MALSAAAHHSFDKVAVGEKCDGLRAKKTDRAGEAANKAPRRQKSKAAGDAVFFELFDEDTAGVRPRVLAEPRPQERVQRHTMEHIADLVCCAPLVQTLDAPVPPTVEQVQDVLQFFDRLSAVPEPVIEVPKIITEDVPMRAVLRDPQLAEQLVEVPTIVSYSSSHGLVEHNVDIPVPSGRGGRNADLQGFLLGQSSTAPQFSAERISERIVEQNVDIPAAGGGLQDFRPGQSSSSVARSPAEWLNTEDEAFQEVLRTFHQNEKSATQPPHSRSELPPHSSPWTPSAYDVCMVLEEEEEESEEDFDVEYVEFNDRLWGRERVPARQQYCWWLAAAGGSQTGHTIWRPPWLIGRGPG